jgi:hypothetical protein
MGLALVCICWRALMKQGLRFCFVCRSFSNTRGREGAGCPRRAQGTCRLGGRSAAEGASVQKTSTSPRAWLWQGLYRIAFQMPRRWYRLRTRSYPIHVQRVPQAGGSRPHPCVGPASFVAPPSDAPRDAHRGRRGVVNGGCGCGVLARLDFFRYDGDMGQALVAPSVCALVGMLLRAPVST